MPGVKRGSCQMMIETMEAGIQPDHRRRRLTPGEMREPAQRLRSDEQRYERTNQVADEHGYYPGYPVVCMVTQMKIEVRDR